MRSDLIPFLFLSLMSSCTSKETDTSSNEVSPPKPDEEASYVFRECEEEEFCGISDFTEVISDEEISSYLNEGIISSESCQEICYTLVSQMPQGDGRTLCGGTYNYSGSTDEHSVTCNVAYHCPTEGRRHAQIKSVQHIHTTDQLGRYFVQALHSESSSVAAFLQLRKELIHHQAPEELIRRCWEAAKDEVQHARIMGHMAQQFTDEKPKLEFGSFQQRSIYDLVLDNAIEGCIFETYSAFKAHHQAQKAESISIRDIMNIISADELRHAQLSWDIHHYFISKLSLQEQRTILEAQKEALHKVYAYAQKEYQKEISTFLAFPTPVLASRFCTHIQKIMEQPDNIKSS